MAELNAPRSRRLGAELPDVAAHAAFAHAQLNDPLVSPWHGGYERPPEAIERMLAAQRAQAAETGFCLWWWRERATGELVGYCGLNRDDVEGEPIVEVGWSIAPARWGEGLATEAGKAALGWGFERCGLDRIVAFALLDNVRSRRVMDKLGMTHVRDFERSGLPHALHEVRRQAVV